MDVLDGSWTDLSLISILIIYLRHTRKTELSRISSEFMDVYILLKREAKKMVYGRHMLYLQTEIRSESLNGILQMSSSQVNQKYSVNS